MQRSLPVVPRQGGLVRAPEAPAVWQAEGWARVQSAPTVVTEEGFRPHVPHVVAWNLTRRCNLSCAHCYISAGSWESVADELKTDECFRIIDEMIAESAAPMLILSGGEPLLRQDLEEIAAYATTAGATAVVGTNGTRLTDSRIRSLRDAGVRGVALSIDSLKPSYHDRFRHGHGALDDTLAGVDRLRAARLDFLVQTTLTRGNRTELAQLVEWAADAGAVSFNLYFLVATGRGQSMSGLTPAENEEVLRELTKLQRAYRGVMMIRSKCQPQIMRHVYEDDPDSPLLNYRTRCPCGSQYCRITPEGRVTPCPYMPVVVGDLRRQTFGEIWNGSAVLQRMRGGELGGKCGRCEYRSICGGCRARAFADSGDYMAEDTSCAYEPTGVANPIETKKSITYGARVETKLEWSPEAAERLERIPGFVRGVVVGRIENFARERGFSKITPEVMSEVRASMPVDFSKRLPFFAQNEDPPA
ncbi:MAG: radical SAM protein [Gemmatimonas sp.]|nr:radical SAM protein [Gemmatimonas sp.]